MMAHEDTTPGEVIEDEAPPVETADTELPQPPQLPVDEDALADHWTRIVTENL